MATFAPHDDCVDRDLERRVQNFFVASNRLSLRHLCAEARHGEITLSGQVRTFHERQLALNYCQRVAGVLTIHDRMIVAAGPAESALA